MAWLLLGVAAQLGVLTLLYILWMLTWGYFSNFQDLSLTFFSNCLLFPLSLYFFPSSSPTSHYPMMMLPTGQALPLLPSPVHSVINVRLSVFTTFPIWVNSWKKNWNPEDLGFSYKYWCIYVLYLVSSWPDPCAWCPTFLVSPVLHWEAAAVALTPPPATASTQRPRWSALDFLFLSLLSVLFVSALQPSTLLAKLACHMTYFFCCYLHF